MKWRNGEMVKWPLQLKDFHPKTLPVEADRRCAERRKVFVCVCASLRVNFPVVDFYNFDYLLLDLLYSYTSLLARNSRNVLNCSKMLNFLL